MIISAVEHPAVKEVAMHLAALGFEVTILSVDRFGLVSPNELRRALRPDTLLVSIMHANNEVGTIEPIAELAAITHETPAVFHSDAAQSLGKIPVQVDELGVDLLSIAGHKLYAPKGIGALYIRRGISLQKQIHGANHERDLRAGTENVLEIVGIGKACELASRDLARNQIHLSGLRDRLYTGLSDRLIDLQRNGHPEKCLPNTLSLSFRSLEANAILSQLEQVAASAGAACHSDEITVSPVLEAMQVPTEWAMGTIRFSVGKMTTEEEIDRAVEAISNVVVGLRGEASTTTTMLDIKLTHFTHGLGCACKLRPQSLEEILSRMPKPTDPAVLVGAETADDAAVYRINDDTAIIETVDFFTPIVDDPYQFGAIAAANALSDVYAMGGTPLFALNLVAFPSNRLPMSALQQILTGAHDKTREAGIDIVGGHTIDDTEPKFGLAVTGIVHPKKIWRNVGAQPGDVLILTKPIGLGILATAMKRGLSSEKQNALAVAVMSELNRDAARIAQNFTVHACTDITGFGLLGHLREMTAGSQVDAEIDWQKVPILEGVWEFAASGVVPGGSQANLQHVSPHLDLNNVPDIAQLILADAQTSGGLLFALPEHESDALLQQLTLACRGPISVIGRIVARGIGKIKVR